MKIKILFAYFLLTTAIYGYIGYNYTFYRMGIYVLLMVLALSFIVGIAVYFVTKKSSNNAIESFFITSSVFFTVLIITELIDLYKPTLRVIIPEDYAGTVYLLSKEMEIKEVHISENGIGFIPAGKAFSYKILQGGRNITDILHTSNSSEIQDYNTDSTQYNVFYIACFDVEKDKIYPTHELNWQYKNCLTLLQFNDLLAKNQIDKQSLFKKTYPVLLNK